LPTKRRGDGSAWKASHAVRRDDGLRLAIAIDIEQHLAAPMFFPDLQREQGRPRFHKRLSNRLGSLEGLVKVPPGFDRCDDMQSFAAGRFEKRMVTKLFEMLLKFQSEFCHPLEREGFGGIEVVDDVIGLFEMRD